MSDPLSLAAGVAGLLALTLQIIQINKNYLDSAKHAPKIIKAYHRELLMLQSSLALLKERLSDPDVLDYLGQEQQQSSETLRATKDGIDGCTAYMQKTLSTIADKAKKPSFMDRMSWYFSEGDIENDLQRLQRYRSMILDDFNSNLAVQHSKNLQNLAISITEVEQLSNTAVQGLYDLNVNIGSLQDTSDKTLSVIESTRDDVERLNDVQDGKSILTSNAELTLVQRHGENSFAIGFLHLTLRQTTIQLANFMKLTPVDGC
jgi:hypothetical protein